MLLPGQVSARILLHLGAVGAASALAIGCKGSAASPEGAPAIAIPSASTHALPVAAPVAGPSAPPIAAAPTTPKPLGIGGECRSDSDCAAGLHCQLNFDGARFTPDPGHCVRERPIYEGRPLVVEGAPRVARRASGGAWSVVSPDASGVGEAARARELAHLGDAAFEEHASVAAFARTICELMALGAPAELVAATSDALADEIAHAEATFAWLAALGAPVQPGPLPEAASPLRTGPGAAEALLRDVFRGGCVGETLAAHRAAERALEAPPEMHAFYNGIAEDEARHAALAFRTVRWLVSQDEALGDVLRAEIGRLLGDADGDARALLAPLLAVL